MPIAPAVRRLGFPVTRDTPGFKPMVAVGVSVLVGVRVALGVGVLVKIGVGVKVPVGVGVGVLVGVGELVGVGVFVGVGVMVGVGVFVGTAAMFTKLQVSMSLLPILISPMPLVIGLPTGVPSDNWQLAEEKV